MKFPIILFALLYTGLLCSHPTNADIVEWLEKLSNNLTAFEKGIQAFLPSNVTSSKKNSTTDAIKANTVQFLLYTDKASRFSPDKLIYKDKASLKASKFNSSNPVKFFIHGLGRNGNCSYPQEIKDVYLANGYDLNIIAVDWGNLSESFEISNTLIATFLNSASKYYTAVKNTAIVGQRVGEMIEFLDDSGVTKLDQIHVVGFSLGAHVAGYAGDYVSLKMHKKIPHITALDPAGPFFQTGLIGRHVNKNDAEFVDFTLTDIGLSGTLKMLGHVNILANGGLPPQPTCIDYYLNSTSPFDLMKQLPHIITGTCSHNVAPIYYQQSILTKIEATECKSYSGFRKGSCSLNPKAPIGDQILSSMKAGVYQVIIKPTQLSGLYSC